MSKLIPLIALIFMLSVTSSTAFAGKIYKWVDQQGQVHYGEHPPSGNSKEMYVPRSSPYHSVPSASSTSKSNTDAANKFLDAVDKEKKEKQKADDKAAKQKAIDDKNCSIARKRVATLKMGGRKFEVDEQGNRHYMDEADIQNRLNQAQSDVTKYCK